MDFAHSMKAEDYRTRLTEFMDSHVYPAEEVYAEQIRQSVDPNHHPDVLEDLKAEARAQGLWNLFLPGESGLTVLEYAPLAEITGGSPEIAPESINCAAPDTGNMEILHLFGTDKQKERWLQPLLDGVIRSCFSMTEPAVASSGATNISTRIERQGDEYVITGRKWFSTGAASPRCKVSIVMGVTNPEADPHSQQSMIIVPMDVPGVVIERTPTLFGYHDRGGHPQILFDGVRVPVSSLLGEEGGGFAIAQARLGPGRIHHCMRALGAAERALALMVARALSRSTFGKRLSEHGVVGEWVAESRIRIEQARLLVLKAAWMIDAVGTQAASTEIAAIRVAAPATLKFVADRAIQLFGAAGFTADWPLAGFYCMARWLQVADGPDEVHLRSIARNEFSRHEPGASFVAPEA